MSDKMEQAYRLLLDAKNEGHEDARTSLAVINSEFMSVSQVVGGTLDNLYPALEKVFSSLPPTELVIKAVNGDVRPIKAWHAQEIDRCDDPYNYNEIPVEMQLLQRYDGRYNIIFVTPTSNRKITIDAEDGGAEVSCDFGGSITAATQVLRYVAYSGKTGNIKYYNKKGDIYYASDIVLGSLDKAFCVRSDSAEHNNIYHNMRYETSGVILNHVPDWMRNAIVSHEKSRA